MSITKPGTSLNIQLSGVQKTGLFHMHLKPGLRPGVVETTAKPLALKVLRASPIAKHAGPWKVAHPPHLFPMHSLKSQYPRMRLYVETGSPKK
jgi:hypothetical protein